MQCGSAGLNLAEGQLLSFSFFWSRTYAKHLRDPGYHRNRDKTSEAMGGRRSFWHTPSDRVNSGGVEKAGSA